jgi:hypothetical protein
MRVEFWLEAGLYFVCWRHARYNRVEAPQLERVGLTRCRRLDGELKVSGREANGRITQFEERLPILYDL